MKPIVHRFVAGAVFGWCALAASSPSTAALITIDYAVVPLAGVAQYEYRYKVTNNSLLPSLSWFSIDFDPALYDEISLLITSVGKADWDELTFFSLPAVPAQYDAYKARGTPLGVGQSESGFAVQFTWLGSGLPGEQAFTVYDPATLNVLDSGVTSTVVVPPPPPGGVPEPASWALTLLALLGCAAAARPRPSAASQLRHTEAA